MRAVRRGSPSAEIDRIGHPPGARYRPAGVLLVAAWACLTMWVAGVGTAVAQDTDGEFGDEFAGEFDDEFAEVPASESTPNAEQAPNDSDFDDSEFDDTDFDEPAETEPSADESDPEPASAESEVGAPEEEEEAEDQTEPRSRQLFRYHNTLEGPTGGLRLVDAAPAAPMTFRVQLATEFFFANDFLNSGDSNSRVGGFFSVSWAVHELVEVFGSISSFANSNETEDPELFQVLGDTVLGAKVGLWVLPWLSVGGDLLIALLNTVGDIGLVLSGTSAGLRGNVSADFRELPARIPLLARFNLQYFFDNSSNLVDDVEQARFDALPVADRRPFEDEDRQLITRVERFALDVNRTDFLNLGLGVEAPLKVARDFFVQPLVEWTWQIPINRQGYDCLFVPEVPGGDDPVGDGCLDRQGLASFPMRLSLGVRVLPPVRGLSALLAVDVGLTGTSTFVRELSPTAPYNILLSVGYAYDPTEPDDTDPVEHRVERRTPVAAGAAPKGRLIGRVFDQETGASVDGAVVAFSDPSLTRLITSSEGSFRSYRFAPGDVELSISHPHYREGVCSATVSEDGGDVEVGCPLVSLPRVGRLDGLVRTASGSPVVASIRLTGPTEQTIQTDDRGRFSVEELPSGEYTASVIADAYFVASQPVSVETQGSAHVEVELTRRPRQSFVRVRARALQLRRGIRFDGNTATLASSSEAILAEVADVMLRTPRIRLLEIQAHTDNAGAPQRLLELSEQRAEAVRQRLTALGVQAHRIRARGFGMTRPLAPNITPANRARNRRVQLVIAETAE